MIFQAGKEVVKDRFIALWNQKETRNLSAGRQRRGWSSVWNSGGDVSAFSVLEAGTPGITCCVWAWELSLSYRTAMHRLRTCAVRLRPLTASQNAKTLTQQRPAATLRTFQPIRRYTAPVAAEPFLNGTSSNYVEEMYYAWLENPKSVHKVRGWAPDEVRHWPRIVSGSVRNDFTISYIFFYDFYYLFYMNAIWKQPLSDYAKHTITISHIFYYYYVQILSHNSSSTVCHRPINEVSIMIKIHFLSDRNYGFRSTGECPKNSHQYFTINWNHKTYTTLPKVCGTSTFPCTWM